MNTNLVDLKLILSICRIVHRFNTAEPWYRNNLMSWRERRVTDKMNLSTEEEYQRQPRFRKINETSTVIIYWIYNFKHHRVIEKSGGPYCRFATTKLALKVVRPWFPMSVSLFCNGIGSLLNVFLAATGWNLYSHITMRTKFVNLMTGIVDCLKEVQYPQQGGVFK